MDLIILGRDGVINQHSEQLIKSADEWEAIPGSLEAIAQLNRREYRVVIISNQAGIGSQRFDIDTLNQIHDKLFRQLAALGGHIECILFCPHEAHQDCDCRKPKPGLFQDLQERLNMPLTNVPVVGDALEDLQAAREVGAKPILVKSGRGMETFTTAVGLDNVEVYDDLAGYVEQLLAQA